MKRGVLLFILLMIGFALCYVLVIRPTKKSTDLLFFADKSPDDLRPIMPMNEQAKYLCELLYDGLVNKTTVKDGRENYQWALVDKGGYREESLDSHFLITIYLRKGVLWHNGREFTADDVIYTWKAINESDSYLKDWMNTFIESIDPVAGNNYKINIKLKVDRSMEAFMELLSPVKIMPRSYTYKGQLREMPTNLSVKSELSEEFKFRPIGTGPYRISKRSTSEKIILEVNEIPEEGYQYFLGFSSSPIRTLRMEKESDPLKAIKDLQKGAAIVFDVKQDFFNQIQDAPLNYSTYLPYSFYAIIYNTNRAPFNDVNFRQAVTLATNKNALAQTFILDPELRRLQTINFGIFPTSSGYSQYRPAEFIGMNEFDVARARECLGKLTSSKNSFHFLLCSQYDGQKAAELAKMYAESMKNLGIEVTVDDFAPPLYNRKMKDIDFDAVLYQFTGFDHLYDIRSLFGEGEMNYWGLRDDRLEKLLKTFGSTIDWEKLVDLARQIQKRINELVPGCFLFTVPRRAYYSNKLLDVTVHPEVGFSTVETWSLMK
jgi:peptide/nickel transport system substrate-binding protein